MTKMYKTAFKSNTNQTVLTGGTVTPLPEATGRTNTALGYKQTNTQGVIVMHQPKTNNMMLPNNPNGSSILAASANVSQG